LWWSEWPHSSLPPCLYSINDFSPYALQPWRWRLYVPPKCQYSSTRLYIQNSDECNLNNRGFGNFRTYKYIIWVKIASLNNLKLIIFSPFLICVLFFRFLYLCLSFYLPVSVILQFYTVLPFYLLAVFLYGSLFSEKLVIWCKPELLRSVKEAVGTVWT
jgi:hypothetical protein